MVRHMEKKINPIFTIYFRKKSGEEGVSFMCNSIKLQTNVIMLNLYSIYVNIFLQSRMTSSIHPYTKVTGCESISLSVCLYGRISLTAEPIGFSLTGKILICPGKVFNYFGYHHPPKRNHKKTKFYLRSLFTQT